MKLELKDLAKLAGVSALALSVSVALHGCGGDDDDDSAKAKELTRLATVPAGAEVTGMFVSENGDLFFNAQHPADSNAAPYNKATVGVIKDVDINTLPKDLADLPVPATDAEKQSIMTAVGEYQILGQEGDTFAGAVPFGLGTMVSRDGTTEVKSSNDPDFNAFVATNDDATEGFLFTNWEDRPGGMSRLQVSKGEDGTWAVTDAMMLDFGNVEGTWVNCFGTLSPWNTPLTSEELYFDDTADWNNPNYKYHGDQENLEAYLGKYPNPYDYGYIVEITNPTGAKPVPVKHYVMGRFSHENSVVMPDNKTVYLSDDGTGTVFYKFVADQAGDLSAGTLYAAKVTQDATNDPAQAGFDIQWVELASATDSQVQSWIDEYDGIDTSDYVEGQTSYISDAEIAAWAAGTAADDRAAFLESRKAAAAKGATAEFRKMEGVNINYAKAADGSVPYMYMAMANFNKTMGDTEGDIQLDATHGDCGVVYQMKLDENYNVSRMEPAIVGGPYDPNAEANNCSVDNISEPDNIAVLDDGRVLIGEDTGEHENNMLWVFDPEAK